MATVKRPTSEERRAAFAQSVRVLSTRELLSIVEVAPPAAKRGTPTNEHLNYDAALQEIKNRALAADRLRAENTKLKEAAERHKAEQATLNEQIADLETKLTEAGESNEQLKRALSELRARSDEDYQLFVRTLYTANRITGLTQLDLKDVAVNKRNNGDPLFSFVQGSFFIVIDPGLCRVTISSDELGVDKFTLDTTRDGLFDRLHFMAMRGVFGEDQNLDLADFLPQEVREQLYRMQPSLPRQKSQSAQHLTLPGGSVPGDAQRTEAP